ncbi:MAG: hypothetical protein KBD15_01700 [Candidatus Magasanikbacteria bacterium]|jgi:hypothetical protein|nr:hypothetical protein [Candidatus Magasanikbacteria bacterium]
MTCKEVRIHVDTCAPMTSHEKEEAVSQHIAVCTDCRLWLNMVPYFYGAASFAHADTSAIEPAAPENLTTEDLCLEA